MERYIFAIRRFVTVLSCSCVLFGVGCEGPNAINGTAMATRGEFPPFFAGTWKSTEGVWEIVFAEDGRITSAVHPLGQVRLRPGKITKIAMKGGGVGMYKAGEWTAQYDGDSRQGTVMMTIESLYVEFGGGSIEGNTRDVLTGEIDEDEGRWIVDWTAFNNITSHTTKYPDFDLSSDPVYGVSTQLTFVKAVGKQYK